MKEIIYTLLNAEPQENKLEFLTMIIIESRNEETQNAAHEIHSEIVELEELLA